MKFSAQILSGAPHLVRVKAEILAVDLTTPNPTPGSLTHAPDSGTLASPLLQMSGGKLLQYGLPFLCVYCFPSTYPYDLTPLSPSSPHGGPPCPSF